MAPNQRWKILVEFWLQIDFAQICWQQYDIPYCGGYGGYFLYQFFTTKILHFLHQNFSIFLPEFFFTAKKLIFIAAKNLFFLQQKFIFYTKNFNFFTATILIFFTPKFLIFYNKF